MRKSQKALLIYERLECKIMQTYKYILSQVIGFESNFEAIHERHVRGLVMRFFWQTDTPLDGLYQAIQNGVAYLDGLLDGEHIIRKDTMKTEKELHCLEVELTVTLAESEEERYDLTKFDRETNRILSSKGICQVPRNVYLNYQREIYRLLKTVPREELRQKIDALKATPVYSLCDQEALAQIEKIVCPLASP